MLQLHIGIGKAQQIERDRRVGDHPAAAGRRARPVRRGAAAGAGAGGRRRPCRARRAGVEIDLVGRHGGLHRRPPVLTPRRGALDGQARTQRLEVADRAGPARPACAPGSSAAGAPSEPVTVAGALAKLPWPESCTGWSSRAAVTSSLSSFSPATAGQVGRADMQRQAGNLRQRRAGVGNLRGQDDIVQRRQRRSRQRTARAPPGRGRWRPASAGSRGPASAARWCRPPPASRRRPRGAPAPARRRCRPRSCSRASGPNSPVRVNGAPL